MQTTLQQLNTSLGLKTSTSVNMYTRMTVSGGNITAT